MKSAAIGMLAILSIASTAMAYEPDAAIPKAVEAASGPNGFSGVALIDVGDGHPWVYATGLASLEPARTNTPDTQFDIGSIGKILTATAMMQLVEAGKVSLDAPIRIYLPDFPAAADRLTVAMLLDHTSGLDEVLFRTEFDGESAPRDNHGYYALIAASPNASAGNGGFAYSNSGFIVAGEVIARVSGQTYEAYLKQHVLDAAGMTEARFSGEASRSRAFGYTNGQPQGRPGGGPMPLSATPYDHPTPDADRQVATAAGGLYARAADLGAYGRAMIENRLISAASLARMCSAMHSLGQMQSGLGCATVTTPDGVVTYGHNGGRPGAQADFAFSPAKRTVTVVLSNHDGRAMTVSAILRRALGVLPDR
jgi:CubicO group peptidase (beta-lactamase class C family)